MKKYLSYHKTHGSDVAFEIEAINTISEKIQKQETINTLMSVEAQNRKLYYRALDKIVKYDDFKIIRREKRPPKNYMNTMISYGNSMMYSTTLTEILKTTMDPRIGYLHASNFRRYSLNLDIAEIFKPVIVDRTIMSLVNRNQIKPADFKGVEGGIHLNDSGKKKFIKEYEDHLNKTIQHKKLNRKVSYKRLIRLEVYKLLKHIIEDIDYIPYEMS
jgi:CRISPR-associated protein Cas1